MAAFTSPQVLLVTLLVAGTAVWAAVSLARARRSLRASRREVDRMAQELDGRLREHARAQESLQVPLSSERELLELKSRFVALVSHEFRTPLGIIMSAVELLKNYRDRLPLESRQELLEDILVSTRRMAGLMEQVLLLGRVDAGKVAAQPVPLDLSDLLGRIADEQRSATGARCPIVLDLADHGTLLGARADAGLLRHILSNLVSNAVKYSPAGAEVRLTARRDGPDAVLAVTDRGIGIPEADQARLFEAFHRATNVGEIPGSGLGLLIVKRCVDLHGGRITVRSQAGAGTAFEVRLPLYAPEADDAVR